MRERTEIAHLGIHHAVQGHAARHGEVRHARRVVQPAHHVEHGFLEHCLQRMCDIEVALLDRGTALARRTEQFRQIAPM